MAIDAALGDMSAQYNLGVEYFHGRNLDQDYAKSANLWRKATDAGHVPAANNLGYLMYYGRGVERDHAEGIKLWRYAAERGWAESQVHLGETYSDGRFLKSDLVEAYAWAKAGKHYAPRMSEVLTGPEIADEVAQSAEDVMIKAREKLNPQELIEAEKRAAEYINKYAPK